MTKEEAEKAAAQYRGGVIARVTRDRDGHLVYHLAVIPAAAFKLIGPPPTAEGEYVVLAPVIALA